MRTAAAVLLLVSVFALGSCSAKTYGALKKTVKGFPELVESLDKAAESASEAAKAIGDAKDETMPKVAALLEEVTSIARELKEMLAGFREAVAYIWLLIAPGVIALLFTSIKTLRRKLMKVSVPSR